MEEEDAEKRVRAKCSGDDRIGDVDRLSDLPDSLLCEVLVYFRTKDVVKSSVLSRRWRNLWKYVPRLALGYGDFPEYKAFVSFVDSFLGFDSDSFPREFRLKSESLELKFDWQMGEPDAAHVFRWIDSVLTRKVEHLHVVEREWHFNQNLKIPPTVYTCKSLVSLKLRDAYLPNPSSVSLPRVKVIELVSVVFTNDLAFEKLISGCQVLESLTVKRCSYDNVKVFRVWSQSLLSFTLAGHCEYDWEEDIVVAIDAPRLEYLDLINDETDSYILHNLGSLVKVDIDTRFNLHYTERLDPNDVPKRNTIRSFLTGISSVRDMVIASDTLEVIYDFSTCEPKPIPLLPNLSSLRVEFSDYRWEMLPIFLESCPNLKSLVVEFKFHEEQPISILPGPHSFLPTLESVEIEMPMIDDVEAFMKLASYFLEKSTILKDFTFCVGDFSKKEESVILKKLLAIPRLSSSCQVIVL